MLSKSTHRLYFLKQLSCAGVPQTQLRHFYLTVIRPVLEYAAPVWHHLITKTQADHWSHTKESHPYHLYMHTRYALWKCHICSRASHYLRLQGSTVQKFFQFHSTAYFPSTQSSSSPSRPTTHHSPTSSLKIPLYPPPEQKSISPFFRMP